MDIKKFVVVFKEKFGDLRRFLSDVGYVGDGSNNTFVQFRHILNGANINISSDTNIVIKNFYDLIYTDFRNRSITNDIQNTTMSDFGTLYKTFQNYQVEEKVINSVNDIIMKMKISTHDVKNKIKKDKIYEVADEINNKVIIDQAIDNVCRKNEEEQKVDIDKFKIECYNICTKEQFGDLQRGLNNLSSVISKDQKNQENNGVDIWQLGMIIYELVNNNKQNKQSALFLQYIKICECIDKKSKSNFRIYLYEKMIFACESFRIKALELKSIGLIDINSLTDMITHMLKYVNELKQYTTDSKVFYKLINEEISNFTEKCKHIIEMLNNIVMNSNINENNAKSINDINSAYADLFFKVTTIRNAEKDMNSERNYHLTNSMSCLYQENDERNDKSINNTKKP